MGLVEVTRPLSRSVHSCRHHGVLEHMNTFSSGGIFLVLKAFALQPQGIGNITHYAYTISKNSYSTYFLHTVKFSFIPRKSENNNFNEHTSACVNYIQDYTGLKAAAFCRRLKETGSRKSYVFYV